MAWGKHGVCPISECAKEVSAALWAARNGLLGDFTKTSFHPTTYCISVISGPSVS